jgi:anti-sigma factor RsiW
MRLLPRKDPLVCREVVEMVTDYLEGALPRAERRRFEAHLTDCPHCTEYLAQMRATIRLTGRLEPEDLTEEMLDDLGGLYRRWRDEEASMSGNLWRAKSTYESLVAGIAGRKRRT